MNIVSVPLFVGGVVLFVFGGLASFVDFATADIELLIASLLLAIAWIAKAP